MLDHLGIRCSDRAASLAFHDAVLTPLGGGRVMDFDDRVAYGTDFPQFWVTRHETGEVVRESHIAFTAAVRAAVEAVCHRAP